MDTDKPDTEKADHGSASDQQIGGDHEALSKAKRVYKKPELRKFGQIDRVTFS